MQTVGFRLAEHHLQLLEDGADAFGVSVHEYARGLLIETLEDAERERLRQEVVELRDEVGRHRDEFAAALLALLLAVRNPAGFTEDEARAWVAENLRSGG